MYDGVVMDDGAGGIVAQFTRCMLFVCLPNHYRHYPIPIYCVTCADAGGPPHGRYLEAILKVSRSSSELIAAYTYPVYANATTSATHPSAVMPDG